MSPAPSWNPDRYRALLLALAKKQCRLDRKLQPRFDHSDIVQNALQAAVEELARFEGTTEAEFVQWLKTILHRKFLDLVRRNTAEGRNPDLEANAQAAHEQSSIRLDRIIAGREASPSRAAEGHEVRDRFAEALEQLPPEWREVVLYRDVCGFKVKEIAEMLSLSEKSVAGHLRRGRERLRDAFPDYSEEGGHG